MKIKMCMGINKSRKHKSAGYIDYICLLIIYILFHSQNCSILHENICCNSLASRNYCSAFQQCLHSKSTSFLMIRSAVCIPVYVIYFPFFPVSCQSQKGAEKTIFSCALSRVIFSFSDMPSLPKAGRYEIFRHTYNKHPVQPVP